MHLKAFNIFIALMIAFCAHAVQAASSDWSPLTAWVGKYPSDKSAHGRAPMLEDANLKSLLKKLLPKAEWAALNQFDTESPVRQMGDYLVVNKCRPHNCPADFAMVVIDTKNQKLWIGFFTREDARVSTRWYANADDYSVLPDEIKKEFLARHGD